MKATVLGWGDFDPQLSTTMTVAKLDEWVKKYGGIVAEAKAPQQESFPLFVSEKKLPQIRPLPL